MHPSEVVFIALRPDISREVIRGIKFTGYHTVISLAPYLKFTDLVQLVKPAATVSRAIPLPTVIYHNCPIPVYNSNETAEFIFSHLGQTFSVDNEEDLHTIWTLTCLITPYYDLLGELSGWTISKGIKKSTAYKDAVEAIHGRFKDDLS